MTIKFQIRFAVFSVIVMLIHGPNPSTAQVGGQNRADTQEAREDDLVTELRDIALGRSSHPLDQVTASIVAGLRSSTCHIRELALGATVAAAGRGIGAQDSRQLWKEQLSMLWSSITNMLYDDCLSARRAAVIAVGHLDAALSAQGLTQDSGEILVSQYWTEWEPAARADIIKVLALTDLTSAEIKTVLLNASRESSASVRASSVIGLHKLPKEQELIELARLITDEDPLVRAATVSAFAQGRHDTKVTVSLLERALIDEREPGVREIMEGVLTGLKQVK
jgi:hypothetical protein